MDCRSYSVTKSHTWYLAQFWNPTPGVRKLYQDFSLQRIWKTRFKWTLKSQKQDKVPLIQVHLLKSCNFWWLMFSACLNLTTRKSRCSVVLSRPIRARECIWCLEEMLKQKRCHKDPNYVQMWRLGLRQGRKDTWGGIRGKILSWKMVLE